MTQVNVQELFAIIGEQQIMIRQLQVELDKIRKSLKPMAARNEEPKNERGDNQD